MVNDLKQKGDNTYKKNIFLISHTSYIFRVNQLIQCALDAVYKKILPTFLGAFSMLLSNFKKLRIQQASANLQQVIEELLNWS